MKQIIFYENERFCCSVYFKYEKQVEAETIEHFFEKICRVVSHIGYNLRIEIMDIL